jgi:hypothetical protein
MDWGLVSLCVVCWLIGHVIGSVIGTAMTLKACQKILLKLKQERDDAMGGVR